MKIEKLSIAMIIREATNVRIYVINFYLSMRMNFLDVIKHFLFIG